MKLNKPTENPIENPIVIRKTIAVFVRNNVIENHPVEISAELARDKFSVLIPGMRMKIALHLGEVAGLLNLAIKQAQEGAEDAPDTDDN